MEFNKHEIKEKTQSAHIYIVIVLLCIYTYIHFFNGIKPSDTISLLHRLTDTSWSKMKGMKVTHII